MAPKLTITFDNTEKKYSPGEAVTGNLQVVTAKETACKAVNFTVEGFGYAQLKKNIFQREVYCSSKYKLWGDGLSSQTLPVGTHRFDFSFLLPSSLPSSFENKNGHVRYICEANLNLHKNFVKNPKCFVTFKVASILDLNSHALAKKPIIEHMEKKVMFWHLQSGSISLTLNISHSGYVPGEYIVINAECYNSSNRQLLETRAELVQTTSFKAGNNNKITHNVVCFITRKLEEQTSQIWSKELLKVPPLPISKLQGCNFIDIHYTFRFRIVPMSGKLKLEVSAPLVIGSIPLQQAHNHLASMNQLHASEMIPATKLQVPSQISNDQMTTNQVLPSAPSLYVDPTLPPPSYEEIYHNLQEA